MTRTLNVSSSSSATYCTRDRQGIGQGDDSSGSRAKKPRKQTAPKRQVGDVGPGVPDGGHESRQWDGSSDWTRKRLLG